tara:strand:+ start:873 stop:1325 length:453 start_codon:yes stop_codon:yes gene_type:complete
LYIKKRLKKDNSIDDDKAISLKLFVSMLSKLFVGKKPPDEIIVKAKLNESKYLNPENFRIMKIIIVKVKYRINIFINCFSISELLKKNKSVNVFLRLISKISINITILNKKYNPPIHCDVDLHKIKLSSICLILSNIEKPVEVNPEIDSK